MKATLMVLLIGTKHAWLRKAFISDQELTIMTLSPWETYYRKIHRNTRKMKKKMMIQPLPVRYALNPFHQTRSSRTTTTVLTLSAICMDCMASYIQVKVEDQYVPDVACPALDCGHLLNPLHYLPILAAKLFTKWSDLLCEKVVLLGFERCYYPNQTCSVLIVNECGGNVRRSKCPNCKKLFCFQCKSPWHSGYRCDEREEMRDVNDMLFGELVETKKWSRCPSCGHCVELVEGCPNVSCKFVFSF